MVVKAKQVSAAFIDQLRQREANRGRHISVTLSESCHDIKIHVALSRPSCGQARLTLAGFILHF